LLSAIVSVCFSKSGQCWSVKRHVIANGLPRTPMGQEERGASK
jgi:hypothetical protein